jgi:hypothetical protein
VLRGRERRAVAGDDERPPRRDSKLPLLRVAGGEGGFEIELAQSWLDENPLSAAALEDEAGHWKSVGMTLEVSGLSDRKVSVLSRG